MTDKSKDHTESTGAGSAPSPFDQPTERFAAQSVDRGSRPLAHTDDDLDFDDRGASSLPTEQIPAFRPAPAPTGIEDQPTTVIQRDDATVPTPTLSPPIVSEPIVSEPIGDASTVAAPVAVPPMPGSDGGADNRRGTLDLGLLVLRLVVGGTLLAHGLQKLTGWWNGPGLGGYRDILVDSGFDHARVLAVAGAVGEVAGGALLILGLLTPIAAATVVAVMINAWCLKQSMVPGLEYFAPEGIEYETVLGAAAAAIILTGPGRISLDGRRKWATRPYVGSTVILILGAAVGVGVWIFLNGANPVI
ncbi:MULTISPECIES: DoxX family protein [unclassified Rhodococcus (in: high G+C Gram-positive bacteria)]|uniref:DoxX family protein n=1 Tax=unclassified Rhodococcus (in: high G+C Gram-positive bacteria) TaxID=192944 RepID=UPI000E0B38F3|nr:MULTISPECIES: DoxX family protein [unclassified Rhodococcus (in: high G+C Gram-positive bacteria)]QKT12380.1 DoxX family protein [Rhodococcus sp. W8901]RDI22491.1 putative oxidoreductase [Rhodococcus sp. AG1013]